jgi:hypothetical protein
MFDILDVDEKGYDLDAFSKCVVSASLTHTHTHTHTNARVQSPATHAHAYTEHILLRNHPHRHADAYGRLWRSEGFQKTYRRKNEFQLTDSTKYFYEQLLSTTPGTLGSADYVPSVQDILRAREVRAQTLVTDYLHQGPATPEGGYHQAMLTPNRANSKPGKLESEPCLHHALLTDTCDPFAQR